MALALAFGMGSGALPGDCRILSGSEFSEGGSGSTGGIGCSLPTGCMIPPGGIFVLSYLQPFS